MSEPAIPTRESVKRATRKPSERVEEMKLATIDLRKRHPNKGLEAAFQRASESLAALQFLLDRDGH